jgi:hypothetical protein
MPVRRILKYVARRTSVPGRFAYYSGIAGELGVNHLDARERGYLNNSLLHMISNDMLEAGWDTDGTFYECSASETVRGDDPGKANSATYALEKLLFSKAFRLGKYDPIAEG